MKLMAPVRYYFIVAFAIAFLPSTAGVTLHRGLRSSWLPTEYQLTPCGHKCAPGEPPKVPKQLRSSDYGTLGDPQKPLLPKSDPKEGPPDDKIEAGSIVRLVDDHDELVQAFALPVQPLAADKSTVQFHRLSSVAPAPAAMLAPAPVAAAAPAPVAVVAASPTDAFAFTPDAPEQPCKAVYVPEMDKMLGHDFVVKEMKYGCVGIPSPDGSHGDSGVSSSGPMLYHMGTREPSQDDSRGGVWYFPPSVFRLWKKTSDGRAPALSRLARKFLGDPQYGDLELIPPGRYEAPWDYQVKGWSLLKPIAPHMQDHVDFKKTAVRLPPWAKVSKVASVECMEKMHVDPHYVCPEDYEAKKLFDGTSETVNHKKLPRSKMVTGVENTERSMTSSIKEQETKPEKTKSSKKKMNVDYFTSSDRSLSGAQGKADERVHEDTDSTEHESGHEDTDSTEE